VVDRPSRVWKEMPLDKRARAAEAFWRDEESPEIDVQKLEAVALLARRLNFRPRSIQALPLERRAQHLAHVSEVADAIATRALVAYHFSHHRPLMSAFLDALGITHDQGLITQETVEPPDRTRLAAAVAAVRASFDPGDVDLYLRTLAALDGDTWGNLEGALAS
jgi:hypothetical protein